MEPSVNLCMGCMNELGEDGVCHHCSYTDDIPHLQSYLAPRTLLDNRYIVGKMLSYNGEGASYICYDTVGKCKCTAREYMPDTLCERKKDSDDLVVNPDCLAKYKTFMSEFADVNRTLSRMTNLDHVVKAKDIFSGNNTTYVILEYVEGVSLKKFLQSNKGYLSWEQVKKLFKPLFTTLSMIHNAGIIHRGISPENIIVTTDCELKLTGFSVSSVRTADTGLAPEFYSGYTAPEQYDSHEWQGTWTDVYAIAAVIYRILTGAIPLDAYSRMRNDRLPDAAQVNPRIPAQISNVLSRAMRVRGEDRIQTVTELVSELFDAKQPTHIEHPKGSTQTIPIQHIPRQARERQEPVQPAKKENKAAAIIGWIVLGLVLIGAMFLLYQLFSGPSDNDSSTSSKRVVVDDADYSEEEDDYASDKNRATAATTASINETGAIMPNVVGLEYATVQKQLGDQFTMRVKYYYDENEPGGIIKEQSIEPDTYFDPNEKPELELLVCGGSPYVQIPDFNGMTKKDYLELLDTLNIKYKVVDVNSYKVGAGYIDSTSVAVGNTINVEKGEVLTVNVSKAFVTKKTETTTESTTEATKATEATKSQTQPTDTQAPDTQAPEPQVPEQPGQEGQDTDQGVLEPT